MPKMKGPGQPFVRDEGFLPQLFLPQHYISYISQKSKKCKKCNDQSCSCGKEMTIEGASAALRVRGRGQGHSLRERKGSGQLCAQEEGARAALCGR